MTQAVPGGWDPEHLPSQSGRTYLITGANAGLGYFAGEALARAGAHVVLSGRNPNRLAAAHEAIEARVPGASVESLLLDVSNPGSIRAAAASVRGGLIRRHRLDGLLLNAGIVHPPKERTLTRDGREIVFATNTLGHFILAGEALTALAKSATTSWTPRIVWLGSLATRFKQFDADDLELKKNYSSWRAYVQSKIVCQMLGFEANARLQAEGVPVESLVAHPGYSIGGRTERIDGVNEPSRRKRLRDGLQAPVTQSKRRGAESLVRALVDPAATGGQLWGPSRGLTGPSKLARPTSRTLNHEAREQVWAACEALSGLPWPFARAYRLAGR